MTWCVSWNPSLAGQIISQVNMLKTWFALEICLVIAICQQVHGARRRSNSTLKYGDFAYSVYTSLHLSKKSSILLRFKTAKDQGMLFYVDDGGVKEFVDAFLVNGGIRLRLNVGSCQGTEQVVNGTFTDLKWHKLVLERSFESVALTVDSLPSKHMHCEGLEASNIKEGSPLFVSNFPTEQWRHIKWSFRDSLWSSMRQGGFEGCIKTPKYSIDGKKYRQAQLLKSERTVPGCSNACHKSRQRGKCYNGGKCLNKIVRRVCDCQGTGYSGLNCTEVAYVDSSAGLRFHNSSKESFAEFHGWPFSVTSELQLYFKTHSTKTALLLYQDDGGKREFLKVSLVNGAVRLNLIGKICTPAHISVAGNFANSSWHNLTVKREANKLFLSVDNYFGKPVTCQATPALSSGGKPKSSLFVGGIPLLDSHGQPTVKRWSSVSLFYDVVHGNSWFQGCVALVRYKYGVSSKLFENAKLVRSPGVSGNCSGETCSTREKSRCKNGGRCLDLVVRTECDCNGTGYYGSYCDRLGDNIATEKSTPTSFAEDTHFSIGPEYHVTSQPFTVGPGYHVTTQLLPITSSSGPTAKGIHKRRNRATSSFASMEWCLVVFLPALLEFI